MTVIAERDGAVLRPAAETDLPQVDAIAVACWTPIHASFRQLLGDDVYLARYPTEQTWQESKISQIRSHFAHRPEQCWVVAQGDQVLGFVTFLLDSEQSVGTIGNNGVAPDSAGQGWGTFMYRHVLQHFRAAGLRLATVGTGLDWGHAPARRAYEAVGFGSPVPMVQYWQDLTKLNPGSIP
ncbi:MAG: GNAT family N-acetyltransferase [Armatimonadetes bacterium]|nr:GNAT family N-acetyltransferase [Armatimonadota bacterium]